jgi:hypothetical protein
MSGDQTEFLTVPGAEHPLVLDRTPDGRLLRLSGAGRLYIDATAPDRTVFIDFATVDTVFLPNGFVRRVRADAASWSDATPGTRWVASACRRRQGYDGRQVERVPRPGRQ